MRPMKTHIHTFVATSQSTTCNIKYICELQNGLSLGFEVPALDFLSAFAKCRVNIFRLGALVGANPLDEFIEILLKHPGPF